MVSTSIVLLFQLFTVLLLAILFSRLAENKFKVGILEISLGFYSIIAITNIVAWVGYALQIYSLFFTTLLILLINKLRKFRKILFDSSLFVFIAVLAGSATMFYLGHGFNLEYRLFINPDPNGYGAVTGAVQAYGTFPNVLNQFQQYTGIPFAYDYNWDKPNPLALIDSPWHIPDSLVKYGIANGFYLHNGISFMALPFMSLVSNPIQTFSILWAFWSIIGSSLIICNLFMITKVTLNKFFLVSKVDSIKILIVTLFITSGTFFLTVFVLEGFANQLVSLAQTLSVFLIGLTFFENYSKKLIIFNVVILILVFLSAWFTYAQQIPFLLYALIVGLLGNIKSKNLKQIKLTLKNNKLQFSITLTSLVILSAVLFNSQGIKEAVRALTKSAGGGALHLGAVSPLAAVGLNSSNSVTILDNIKDKNEIPLNQKVWPNSAYDDLGWNLVEQGYSLNLTSMSSLKFLLVLFLLAGLFLILFKPTRKFTFLVILLLPFVIILYYYLYIRSGNYLKIHQSALFSDYVWVRLLSIFGVFTIPVIGTVISFMLISKEPSQRGLKKYLGNFQNYLIVILVISTIFRTENIYRISKDHINKSQASFVSASCPEFLDGNPAPFLVTDKIVPELSLALCGRELNLLTDSFPVKIDKNSGTREVIQITKNINGVWVWAKLGELTVVESFTTPCNISCLKQQSGFKPYNDTFFETFANLSSN